MSHTNPPVTLAVCLFGLLLYSSPAQATRIDIYDGATRVGGLLFDVNTSSQETANFTLLDPYRNLMSDALGLQVRFFQVIYYDDEPVPWNGAIITPAQAAAHTGTLVDVPAGGWDYEKPAGDDFSPFYESDTANNPVTGLSYAFPTLSYPALHTADGLDPGRVRTEDAAGLTNANHQTLFETYLVFMDPALSASRTFDILGGFSWGIRKDAFGIQSGTPVSGIDFSSIDSAKLLELRAALNRSGYGGDNGWTVQAVSDFYPLASPNETPEPEPIVLFFSGIVLLLVRRLLIIR